MNVGVIVVELLAMFLAFGFLVIGLLLISPLTFISDYPPEIQEAYYRTQKKEATKEKLNAIMLVKKGVALIAFLLRRTLKKSSFFALAISRKIRYNRDT